MTTGFERYTRKTRRALFLEEMEQVVPWRELCALIGVVYGPIQPIYNYVMQTRAPHQLRGRVVGVMTGLMYAAGPLGLLVAGPLTDAAGLQVTFLALAVPILVVGLVACGLPSLRELDRAPEFAADSGP